MDYIYQAEAIFNKIPFVKFLDAKLVYVDEENAKAQFAVSKEHTNYMGGLHGGIISGVFDTVAFFPGKLLPSGLKLTTAGFDIKFFRPVSCGEIIIANATIIHFGKKRVNVETEAFFKNTQKIISKANIDLMII